MQNFELHNSNGEDITLYDYQGNSNVLLVFFRGAWCNHCKKQLQDINNHFSEFEKLKIKILAISCDTKFNSSLLKSFLGLKFSVASDTEFKIIDALNLRTEYKGKEVAKPAVFIVSPNHEIAYQYVGRDYDDRLSAQEILKQYAALAV